MGSVQNPQGTVQQIKSALETVASLFVVLGFLAGIGLWISGGLKPQTQVAVDDLSAKVLDLRTIVQALKDKFDALPRQTDYAAHEARLSRIDGQLAALGDRLTRDEIEAAATRTQVQRLIDGSSAPVRIPR